MNPPKKGASAEEATSEAITARFETLDRRLNRVAELLEANSEQIASFTEGLTRLENLIERGFSNIDNRLAAIARTAERQQELATSQQATVARLVELQAATQTSHNRTVERWESMIERLLPLPQSQAG